MKSAGRAGALAVPGLYRRHAGRVLDNSKNLDFSWEPSDEAQMTKHEDDFAQSDLHGDARNVDDVASDDMSVFG